MPGALHMEARRKEFSGNPTAHGAEVGQHDLYLGLTMPEATAVAHGRKLGMRDWLRRSRCLSLFRLKGLADAIRAAISCLKIRFQFWRSVRLTILFEYEI